MLDRLCTAVLTMAGVSFGAYITIDEAVGGLYSQQGDGAASETDRNGSGPP
jgi:hypothetical protein